MVDHNLTPELIHKLTSLDENSQNALTHYLLRSDEQRRARVKEVYQVQPRFEQVALFDFKRLEGFKEGFLVTNMVISSSGEYAIITTDDYKSADDFPEEGSERRPTTAYLYVLDLADKGKVLHQDIFVSNREGVIWQLVISPQDNYYAIIVANTMGPVIYIYNFKSFEEVKSIGSEQFDFEPATVIFSQDDRAVFFVDLNGSKEYKMMSTSIDPSNEFIKVIGYLPWYCNRLGQHPNYDYLFASGQGRLAILDIQTGTVLKNFELNRLDYGMIFFDPCNLCFVGVDISKSFMCQWDYLTKEPTRIEYAFFDRGAWGGKEERKYGTWYELPKAPLVVCGTLPYVVRTIYENRAWKLTLHDIYTGSLESEIDVGPAREVMTEARWVDMMARDLTDLGDVSELDDTSFSDMSHKRTVLAMNNEGTAVFFINDVLQQGHLLRVQDFKVSLHDLLAMIYSDRCNKPLHNHQ